MNTQGVSFPAPGGQLWSGVDTGLAVGADKVVGVWLSWSRQSLWSRRSGLPVGPDEIETELKYLHGELARP